jgi:hypothetical protein
MATDAELDALRQTYEVSLRQMQTFLDAQARMIDVAQDRALEAREELERVAEALSPGMVDEKRRESPKGISHMANRELADAVIRHVKGRLAKLEAAYVAGRDESGRHGRMAAENARLREQMARVERELAGLRGRLAEEQTRAVLQGQDEGSPGTPADLPDWMQAWQREPGYEQDLALLRTLAEAGLISRADVVRVLEQAGVDASTLPVFARCERLGLIALVAAGADGKDTLVHLTDLGRQTCQLLLDLEPADDPGALLARHGDPGQVLLVLEAAGLLREAGYAVDLLPDPVALDDGRTLVPDLAASLDARTVLVAVERNRAGAGAEPRWADYHEATGGELYVVVPDNRTLEAVKGSILFWAGTWQKLALKMCDIEEVRGGGKQGDEIWTLKRGQ